MHEGRVLATDTPEGLVKAKEANNLEDAFIRFLEQERATTVPALTLNQMHVTGSKPTEAAGRTPTSAYFSLERLFAYTIREGLELDSPCAPRLFFFLVRHHALDDRVRLRHFHGREQSHLRRSRPGSDAREPCLSGGAERFALLRRKGADCRLCGPRPAPEEWRHLGLHRNPAQFRSGRQARATCLRVCLDRRRHARISTASMRWCPRPLP